uniref:Uncharacterized protein n=1 Tax=Candidatus Kentrum sp. FW TaxID=2126338 RepID=A0A450T7Q0_9GAMM|nr:MAG: hypothetical protein BECKFW1821C_GA0114237_100288 [Candidatus Kentron sp. FW]
MFSSGPFIRKTFDKTIRYYQNEINDRNSFPVNYVSDAVTTGSNWKFPMLKNNLVSMDFNEYLISQVGKIVGILVRAIKDNSIPGR